MSAKSRPNSKRCHYTFDDGRRCRLIRAEGHATLCLKHWRLDQGTSDRETQSLESAALVAELLGSGAQLNTTTAVNDTLSKLVMLRARKQISSRDTALIAYIIQLLLQTLHGTKDEFTRLYRWSDWDNILDRTIQRAIASDGSLQAGIPDSNGTLSEFLHRRKRPIKIPATREEFAEQVLTEYALSKGMIDEPPDDEEHAAAQDSDEGLPACRLPAEGMEGRDIEAEDAEVVKNGGFVVHVDRNRNSPRPSRGRA